MQQNRLLSIIAQRHSDCHWQLQRIDFVHGDSFGVAGATIGQAVFPISGLISVVVPFSDGSLVEAAMVGHDGVVGGVVGFGIGSRLNSNVSQLPGTAYLLPAKILADISSADEKVRSMLFAHEQFMLAQAQQMAACNARHHIMQRLSGWLLRAQDLSGSGQMILTQECLAQMLGVQRASVTGCAIKLQDMELIRYRRGQLTITDPAGLARQACECHVRVQACREALLLQAGDPLREAH